MIVQCHDSYVCLGPVLTCFCVLYNANSLLYSIATHEFIIESMRAVYCVHIAVTFALRSGCINNYIVGNR